MAVDTSVTEGLDPLSLAEAKRRPDWESWQKAIQEEIHSLVEARTWEVVEKLEGINVVGSKWVFCLKKDALGRIAQYKARLVAQGFSQVEGIDYFDTYAPVAKLASIRTILALAARLDLEIHQIDIKSAYLNGELNDNEKIYMRQPPGFPLPNATGKVLRLRKMIYGLKQSGRRWYQAFTKICSETLGLKRCDVDQAVFYWREGESLIVIAVHVDDCTIVATTLELMAKVKQSIGSCVEVVDMGPIHWLLGIEIVRDRERRTIAFSQKSYIESTLRRFNMDELKPLSTPMDPNANLSSAQSPTTLEEIGRM